MKIYIKADSDFENCIYPWYKNIEEQIKETTSLISAEYEISILELSMLISKYFDHYFHFKL